MTDTPLSAIEVVRHLSALAAELSRLVREIGIADRQATHAREGYTLARAVAFRQASGAVAVREAVTLEVTHGVRLAAEEAECRVRDLRRQIDAIKIRIDVGRSYGAAVRAESVLLNSPFQEHP